MDENGPAYVRYPAGRVARVLLGALYSFGVLIGFLGCVLVPFFQEVVQDGLRRAVEDYVVAFFVLMPVLGALTYYVWRCSRALWFFTDRYSLSGGRLLVWNPWSRRRRVVLLADVVGIAQTLFNRWRMYDPETVYILTARDGSTVWFSEALPIAQEILSACRGNVGEIAEYRDWLWDWLMKRMTR